MGRARCQLDACGWQVGWIRRKCVVTGPALRFCGGLGVDKPRSLGGRNKSETQCYHDLRRPGSAVRMFMRPFVWAECAQHPGGPNLACRCLINTCCFWKHLQPQQTTARARNTCEPNLRTADVCCPNQTGLYGLKPPRLIPQTFVAQPDGASRVKSFTPDPQTSVAQT